MQSFSFNVGQKFNFVFTPEDSNDNPGLIVGSVIPTWAASPGSIVTIATAANGLSADITGVAPGVTTVTVTFESSSGTVINEPCQVTINEAPATQGAFAATQVS